MKLNRRGMLATAAGGMVAVAQGGQAGVDYPPAPQPGGYYGLKDEAANLAREPSVQELREMRAKYEAHARGEGWANYSTIDRYGQPWRQNVESLKSVSPAGKHFINAREEDRRSFERYCQEGKEQLEHFVRHWAWKLL